MCSLSFRISSARLPYAGGRFPLGGRAVNRSGNQEMSVRRGPARYQESSNVPSVLIRSRRLFDEESSLASSPN